jgi:hypothetical protein
MKLGTFAYICCLYVGNRIYKKNTFENGCFKDSVGNLSLKLKWVLGNWIAAT